MDEERVKARRYDFGQDLQTRDRFHHCWPHRIPQPERQSLKQPPAILQSRRCLCWDSGAKQTAWHAAIVHEEARAASLKPLDILVMPVTLPPGRLRLATRPIWIG